LIAILGLCLRWENARRDAIQAVAEIGDIDTAERRRDLDDTAFLDVTDRENGNFRYIY